MQGNPSIRRSAVGSGLVTGLSIAAVSASAAGAGAILSRKFGHGVKTDGFFAAYSVYLALVLVANALRVVLLPRLARAEGDRRLARVRERAHRRLEDAVRGRAPPVARPGGGDADPRRRRGERARRARR